MKIRNVILTLAAVVGIGVGAFVAADHFGVFGEQEQELTAAQKQEFYTKFRGDLTQIFAAIDKELADEQMKTSLTTIGTNVPTLQKLLIDYKVAKEAGAAADKLDEMVKTFAETARPTAKAGSYVFGKIGPLAMAVNQRLSYLSQIDPEKLKGDLPEIQKLTEKGNAALKKAGGARQILMPVLQLVGKELGPRAQAGVEISDAEETASFLKASKEVLDAYAAQ